MRIEFEKFDGRINFGLWHFQVKDVLIQSGQHKESKGDVNHVTTSGNPWRCVDNQDTLKKIVRIEQVWQIALNQYMEILIMSIVSSPGGLPSKFEVFS